MHCLVKQSYSRTAAERNHRLTIEGVLADLELRMLEGTGFTKEQLGTEEPDKLLSKTDGIVLMQQALEAKGGVNPETNLFVRAGKADLLNGKGVMPLLMQISRLQAADAQLNIRYIERDEISKKVTSVRKDFTSCLLLQKRAELIRSITEMKEKNPEAYETIVKGILNEQENIQDKTTIKRLLNKEYAVTPEEIEECLSELLSKENLNNLAETILPVGNQTATPTDTEAGRRSVNPWDRLGPNPDEPDPDEPDPW